MNAKNDGGPAFPRDSHMDKQLGLYVQQEGMSLRDWFAGQALAGLLACPDVSGSWESISKSAYTYADAMLRARERWREGGGQ